MIKGTTIGVTKGESSSLDYSSDGFGAAFHKSFASEMRQQVEKIEVPSLRHVALITKEDRRPEKVPTFSHHHPCNTIA